MCAMRIRSWIFCRKVLPCRRAASSRGALPMPFCLLPTAIDAPFAVINADDYYGRTCFELIYNYLSAGHTGPKYPWVMVGYLWGNTVSTNGSVSRGVCVTDADGNLDTVTERTRIETYDSGIHYTEDGGENLGGPARGYGRFDEHVGLYPGFHHRGQSRV